MKNILLLAAILVSLQSIAQVPSYVPTNGVVAFWPFSGNANDASGNGNNGTPNNATLTTDRLGFGSSAYLFTNTTTTNDSYIQANVTTNAITTSGAMTLSFWVYRVGDGYDTPGLMEFGSCGTCAGQILIRWGNGNNPISLRHYLDATNFITYNFTGLNSTTWYNIVYTNDGTTAKYYLNGTLVSTMVSPVLPQLLGNVAFGRMNHLQNDAFNGKLDDIGLWSRALTPCEVNALYTGNPVASFAYNALQDTTFSCDSLQLDAQAGYTNYAWSNGNNAQTTWAKQSGLYKVTVTNSTGCTAVDSTQFIIIKPTISQKDTTVCAGSSIPLAANGIAASSQTVIDNFSISALAYNTHTVTTVIGQTYSLVVSGTWSVHGCPGTDVNNPADAAFYLHSPFPALPTNLDWVIWNGVAIRPDGNTYDAVNHTYTYTLPPSTQVSQTFASIDLSDPPPHTNPSAYSDNCGGLTFQISQINKSNAVYTWSAIPAATAGLSAPDINKQSLIVKPTATTIYYVNVNDGITNCEDSVQIFMATVDTSLIVSGATTVCGNANVTFTAGIDNSYKWLLNNNAIPGAVNSTYNATQTGSYSVAVANSIGCIDTSRSVAISLYPKPVAGFTINNASQCLSGNSFTYTNTSSISVGTLSYQWNLGDGQKAFSLDTTYTYTAANNAYSVKLISTSNNGCSDSITETVAVKPMPSIPTITANGPLRFCQNGTVVLMSDTAQGNQWYQNGNKLSNAVNQNYTDSTNGDYTITATANGCTSNASAPTTVQVDPIPSTPTAAAQGPVSFCANGNVILSSNAADGNQWYTNGNEINGATNQTYTANAAGSYTVITTVNNCPSNASNSVTVTISPNSPTPAIAANGPLTFCANGNVVLSSNAASGNQWYISGYPIAQANGTTYTAVSAGVYTVIATDPNSCPSAASDGVSITILPSPHGIRYDAINTAANTATILQARDFGEDYSWIPSTGLTDATTATPTFNYTETTDYLIHITTSAGCFTDDTVLVNVYDVKGILVPTAFTPNGDGLNDVLKPFTIDIKQLNYFRIFNKWGQLIFESNNTAIGWDGTYQGTAQPTGNYIWIGQGVDNNGHLVNQHGQVLLIR